MSTAARLHYRLFPGERDEAHCSFISSRGLLKICDHHRRRPRTGTKSAPRLATGTLRPGATIHVGTKALAAFADTILPRIRQPFVLVSGDSDVGVNPEQIEEPTLTALFDNACLQAWYAQNLTQIHDKQVHLPIGMDYHTLSEGDAGKWGTFRTPVDQEESLIAIARAAPPPNERKRTGYCNWHFALHRGSREACKAALDPQATFYEPEPATRDESWARNARMLFTISPTGSGTDCHRTWEAIALGTIPIVDKSELSPLFASLPVIEVDDWRTVTPAFLEQMADTMLTRRYNFAPMFLGYWKCRFECRPAPELDMTLQEFVARGVETAKTTFSDDKPQGRHGT